MEQGEGQKPGRRRDPTGELIGSYAVISQIASGEATTVHLAQKHGALGFHRLAAIKRLKPTFAKNGEWKQLLLDEARLSAGVHHVNIVDVIDVGTDNGCYLVMDYVEGSDLDALLSRAGKERHARYVLPPIVDALHGLQAVHTALDEDGESLALVHQAPTARHILIGIDGTARLTDFSQVSAHGLLPLHLRYGRLKSPYMAPEQLRGNNPVDARTDLFILGITLWEALTGERLFHADTMELSRRAVLERHVPRPSDVGLRPPRALDALCLRALARDPDDRYQSAAEMARELRDIGLNEALYATSGEVGQWVRALAGRALIERRRAIGADAPSAELAIDSQVDETDGEGALAGPSSTLEIASTPSRVGAAPSSTTKPVNGDRTALPGEPSRVTRLYTVAVAAPPGGSSSTLLGTPLTGPAGSDKPEPTRPGDRRDSAQPGPGAYRHLASDRRGLTTLPETAAPRDGAAADGSLQAGSLRAEVVRTSPSAAALEIARAEAAAREPARAGAAESRPGTALVLSGREPPASTAYGSREAAFGRAEHAARTRGSFDEADGSLRPPNRAAHMDLPGSDEASESSRALGFIAALSVAIIVLAGVVGIRQWKTERELLRTGKQAVGAQPLDRAPAQELQAAPTLPAVVTPIIPGALGSSAEAASDAGIAGAQVAAPTGAGGVRKATVLGGPSPGGARRPLPAPARPPLRGPGADLPVKYVDLPVKHVGVPDNPY